MKASRSSPSVERPSRSKTSLFGRLSGAGTTQRDTWLAAGLILLLVIITAAVAAQQTIQENIPPLASSSNRRDGASALRNWLDALGYTTLDWANIDFNIPDDTELALILEPTLFISELDWRVIDPWVEAGGTLILTGSQLNARFAMDHYGFALHLLNTTADELTLQTPWWSAPPVTGQVRVQAGAYLETRRDDFVTHLAAGSRPVIVSLRQGEGWVILSAAPFPFSNAGLKEAGNPALVLNLLALAPRSGRAWFDEWHHGVRPTQHEIIGPGQWLRYTPGGQALLFALAVILLAVLLQGQNFGRPVRPLKELQRRTPLEYITALANLSRRAGHRKAVVQQLYHQIKRELGKRYRIDPTLPDKDYIQLLAQARPGLDAAALHKLLQRLKKEHISEKEMIQLAREASSWLAQSSELRPQ